jgi:hypothetical protein
MKKMTKKNKNGDLQNNSQYVLSKLGECIPKGIILYYPLVYTLNSEILDKNAFDNFFVFFSLKKTDYLYSRLVQD